jgi:hypothetical protein
MLEDDGMYALVEPEAWCPNSSSLWGQKIWMLGHRHSLIEERVESVSVGLRLLRRARCLGDYWRVLERVIIVERVLLLECGLLSRSRLRL